MTTQPPLSNPIVFRPELISTDKKRPPPDTSWIRMEKVSKAGRPRHAKPSWLACLLGYCEH